MRHLYHACTVNFKFITQHCNTLQEGNPQCKSSSLGAQHIIYIHLARSRVARHTSGKFTSIKNARMHQAASRLLQCKRTPVFHQHMASLYFTVYRLLNLLCIYTKAAFFVTPRQVGKQSLGL